MHLLFKKSDRVDAFLRPLWDDPSSVLQLLFTFFVFSLPAILLLQLLFSKSAKVSARFNMTLR